MCNWFRTQYFALLSIIVTSSNPTGQDQISVASAVILCRGKINPVFSHPAWNAYLVYRICRFCEWLGCVASPLSIKTTLLGCPSCASPSGRLWGENGRRRLCPCPKGACVLIADTGHSQCRALGIIREVTEEPPASTEERASGPACGRNLQRRQHSSGTTEDSGLPGRRERKNSRCRRWEKNSLKTQNMACFGGCKEVRLEKEAGASLLWGLRSLLC